MRFNELPLLARMYIIASALVSAGLLGAALVIEPIHPDKTFYYLLVAMVLSSVSKVDLTVKNGRMNLSNAVIFLAIMLCKSVATPMLIAGLSAVIGTVFVRARRPDGTRARLTWYKMILSASNLILSGFTAACLWQLLDVVSKGALNSPDSGAVSPLFLAALMLVTGSYFLINTLGISLAVGLAQRLNLVKVWKENFVWTFPGYLCAACAAGGAHQLYASLKVGAFLLLPPVYVVYYSYKLYLDKINTELRHVQDLNELNGRVIGTLAMTIEAKDRYTHKHVERVREYALAIAKDLSVSGPDLEAVRIGSMVHDIGKIAVPEMILTKPGKLTSEEFERMQTHVGVGVKILEVVNFPFPAVDAVAAHHERWDGNGYPNGLKGDEIPLVGRIVALADGFDALTSDRHYRKGMSHIEAMEFIESQKGKQYDPTVVDALVRALPKVKPTIDELDRQQFEADEFAGHRRMIPQEALEEIARAAEEAVVLAEMALKPNNSHSPKEVIDLLLEKALLLIPGTTGAVFLVDEDQQEVRVQGSRGLYSHLLDGLSMKVGEGVSGWVVAQSTATLNAPAAGDLARRVQPGQNLELNSALSVPLENGTSCIGAITIYHTGYNLYNAHHQRLLATLASHASTALDTLAQLEANQTLAHTDSLTELPNMRFLIQHLEKLTTVQKEPFSVLLLDLNGFKLINDTLGHLEGDRVLRDVAQILRNCIRGQDLAGRYAGDEFVVVCHGTNGEDACLIVERIREGFEEYAELRGEALHISTSIGVSGFPVDGADWRSLLSAADRRMYKDKLIHHENMTVVNSHPLARPASMTLAA
ncbi:MAG: diguanylate cyclase [Armatimonadota bacterium]|nr:diguanylate cyclase [Armatimonadota bacterium]